MTRCALMAALIMCIIPDLHPFELSCTDLTGIAHGDAGGERARKQGRNGFRLDLSLMRDGRTSGNCGIFLRHHCRVWGDRRILIRLPASGISQRYFYEKEKDTKALAIGTILGTIVLYALGSLWFMICLKTDLLKTLLACVLPFLPGDAVKIFLVCLFTPKLRAVISRYTS